MAKRYIREKCLPDSAIDLIDRTLAAAKMINQSGADDIRDFRQRLAEIEEAMSPEKLRAKVGHLETQIRGWLSPILLGRLPDRGNAANTETPGASLDRLQEDLEHLSDLIEKKISVITIHEVAAMVSASTGIPIGKIESGEKERLLGMEDILRRRVVGQDNDGQFAFSHGPLLLLVPQFRITIALGVDFLSESAGCDACTDRCLPVFLGPSLSHQEKDCKRLLSHGFENFEVNKTPTRKIYRNTNHRNSMHYVLNREQWPGKALFWRPCSLMPHLKSGARML